jgi:hypothetical protein
LKIFIADVLDFVIIVEQLSPGILIHKSTDVKHEKQHFKSEIQYVSPDLVVRNGQQKPYHVHSLQESNDEDRVQQMLVEKWSR